MPGFPPRTALRAADVAWASAERMAEIGNRSCFPNAPEICGEVVSPRNSKAAIDEKIALYFDAGAKEVWLCSASGKMTFLIRPGAKPRSTAIHCPKFPGKIVLS